MKNQIGKQFSFDQIKCNLLNIIDIEQKLQILNLFCIRIQLWIRMFCLDPIRINPFGKTESGSVLENPDSDIIKIAFWFRCEGNSLAPDHHSKPGAGGRLHDQAVRYELMVLILGDSSDYDAHAWSELGNMAC